MSGSTAGAFRLQNIVGKQKPRRVDAARAADETLDNQRKRKRVALWETAPLYSAISEMA